MTKHFTNSVVLALHISQKEFITFPLSNYIEGTPKSSQMFGKSIEYNGNTNSANAH